MTVLWCQNGRSSSGDERSGGGVYISAPNGGRGSALPTHPKKNRLKAAVIPGSRLRISNGSMLECTVGHDPFASGLKRTMTVVWRSFGIVSLRLSPRSTNVVCWSKGRRRLSRTIEREPSAATNTSKANRCRSVDESPSACASSRMLLAASRVLSSTLVQVPVHVAISLDCADGDAEPSTLLTGLATTVVVSVQTESAIIPNWISTPSARATLAKNASRSAQRTDTMSEPS